MKHYEEPISLVTGVVRQHKASDIIDQLVQDVDLIVLQTDARGTLLHQNWFKRLLPTVSPEFEYLQFAVKKEEAKKLLVKISQLAELNRPGNGAVFVIECDEFISNNHSFLCEQALPFTLPNESINGYKENVYAFFSLVQSGHTDKAIRAAVNSGSHGPIVFLAEGRGTRDKVPWLKITKRPYEEVIVTIVDKIDHLPVKDALVSSGKINTVGGGLLYEVPVTQACVNLPGTMTSRQQLASTQHIVAAIDELLGHTDWRDCSNINAGFNGATSNKLDTATQKYLLTLVLPRKYAYEAVDLIIEAGAPGANLGFYKEFAGRADCDERGFIKHHEIVMVRVVVSEKEKQVLKSVWMDYIQKNSLEKISLFSHKLSDIVR